MILKELNQSDVRYVVTGHWNKLILLVVCDTMHPMKEKRILM
jgi:hypothetical protein